MKNFDWQYVIDGVAAFYGLYVFLSALKMKATGEISSFVASPEEMKKCKRKKEFAGMVSAKMIVFGVVAFLFGVSNIINEILWKNVMYNIVSLGVFLLACGLFIGFLRKSRAEYLGV